MNIGIDARLWNETGVGRYIRALVTQLTRLDSPHVYTLFLRKHEYESLTFPQPQFKLMLADVHWHTISEQLRMPQIYKQANLDLLHIPYFSVPLAAPTPYIVTIHDLTISQFPTGQASTKSYPEYLLKRLGYRYVLSRAISRAAKVITVSEYVKKHIITACGTRNEKISVIYESGEMEKNTRSDDVVQNISFPQKYILYVGNAYPHKNLGVLVDGFALFKELYPDFKLVFIGRTDIFYDRLKKYCLEKKLTDSVLFTGEQSSEQLQKWYARARVFVFPSKSEGFGIPGLEAMSQKCPVIASDLEVFREIYEDAAIYFDEGSAQSLKNKLIELEKNEIRSSLIIKGLGQIEKYSWKKMAQETLALYENCARI